jgi:CspA family cold shock protein
MRETGTVLRFNNEKGFGFIGRPGGCDLFVHYTSIEMDGFRTLTEGQTVEFEVVKTAKGYAAIDVTRVGA